MLTLKKFEQVKVYDFTTGYLLDYTYFNKHYKLIAIDLSKQPRQDAYPKAVQQINFAGNLGQPPASKMSFITEEGKETTLNFSKGTLIILNCILINYYSNILNLFCSNIILVQNDSI